MKKILLSLLVFSSLRLLACPGMVYENADYKVSVSAKGEMLVTCKQSGAQETFLPDWRIAYAAKAPKVTLDRISKNGLNDNLNYRAVAWNKELDLFKATQPVCFEFQKVDRRDNKAIFYFKPNDLGELRAILEVPYLGGEPRLQFKFLAARSGAYSIGFCGSPACVREEAEEFWQPLVWTQKRFPSQPYLTPSNLCPLPLAAVSREGHTYGVCASPESFPFQPMPTQKNYTFGVMLRDEQGNARPMLWAPVLGVPESVMESGRSYSFAIRLICNGASMMDTHEKVALGMYGLAGYHRTNVTGSLNTALDNMIDYGMSSYSWFVDSLKGCSYETDVKGAVKNTSAINPLEIALITGREDIFRERFLPMLEFVLSRESLLFSLNPRSGEGGQKPLSSLGKPVIPASEGASLYEATGRQIPFLINEIQEEKGKNKLSPHEQYWRNQLALYNATGQKEHLDNAVAAAEQYLEQNIYTVQDLFDYKNQSTSSFWTQLAPRYQELYNMYEATGDGRFLEAARYAARRYAQYIWMSPAIPRDSITVNPGGLAPKQKPWGEPIKVPEEKIPAWRVSEIGLHCECAATSTSHRGVFPASHAAYMRRIGELTGDALLSSISNWAITGRYSNFPGYHMNTARTTVYEKPDFPLRTHLEMNVNSMHYNHIWPQMSIVLDYIVSDIEMLSGGQIKFPYAEIEAFANLCCRMYGHAPGTFYGNEAILWMPQRLLTCSDAGLNYLSARSIDGRKLYLAFANHSDSDIDAEICLDGSLVRTAEPRFRVRVPKDGLQTLTLDVESLETGFQERLLAKQQAWKHDYNKDAAGRAMVINVAGTGAEVFAYVNGNSDSFTKAEMHCRFNGGQWKTFSDTAFPFEFSIPLDREDESVEWYMTLTEPDGSVKTSLTHTLSKQ